MKKKPLVVDRPIAIRLEKDLHARLSAIAKQESRSLSGQVRLMLRDACEAVKAK